MKIIRVKSSDHGIFKLIIKLDLPRFLLFLYFKVQNAIQVEHFAKIGLILNRAIGMVNKENCRGNVCIQITFLDINIYYDIYFLKNKLSAMIITFPLDLIKEN